MSKCTLLLWIVLIWVQLSAASSCIKVSTSQDNCESKCCISIVNGKRTANKACYVILLMKELKQCRADIYEKKSQLSDVFNSINEQLAGPVSEKELLRPYVLLNKYQNDEIEKLNRELEKYKLDIAGKDAAFKEYKLSIKDNNEQCEKYKLEIARKDAAIQNIAIEKTNINGKLNAIQKKFDKLSANTTDSKSYPTSCRDFGDASGIHMIKVPGIEAFNAKCESRSPAGRGWTVILSRKNKHSNFDRNWQNYKDGFGDLDRSFWLGLEKIHLLTVSQPYEVYIYWKQYDEYAYYDSFEIGSEAEFYKLKLIGKYTGDYRDVFEDKDQMKFITYDRDNDDLRGYNCAEIKDVGWWYNKDCDGSHTPWFSKVGVRIMIRPKKS